MEVRHSPACRAQGHVSIHYNRTKQKAPDQKTGAFCVVKYWHMTNENRYTEWYEDEHTSSPDLDEDANELDIDDTYNDRDYD